MISVLHWLHTEILKCIECVWHVTRHKWATYSTVHLIDKTHKHTRTHRSFFSVCATFPSDWAVCYRIDDSLMTHTQTHIYADIHRHTLKIIKSSAPCCTRMIWNWCIWRLVLCHLSKRHKHTEAHMHTHTHKHAFMQFTHTITMKHTHTSGAGTGFQTSGLGSQWVARPRGHTNACTLTNILPPLNFFSSPPVGRDTFWAVVQSLEGLAAWSRHFF